MMGRAFGLSLRHLGVGWRLCILTALLMLLGVLAPYRNPWDLIADATSNQAIPFLLIPGYLLLLIRDLRHPWEALVGIRVGGTGAWWGAQILTAGAVAVILTGTLVAGLCAVAVMSHHWAWHWNAASFLLVGRHVMATWAPWWWSVDALSLMTAGFWATGALWTLCALWWRSGWLAWFGVVALSLMPSEFILTRAQFVVWALPGPQFAWIQHWEAGWLPPPPSWSFGYATVLLGTSTLLGWRLVGDAAWDARHGGPMG